MEDVEQKHLDFETSVESNPITSMGLLQVPIVVQTSISSDKIS